MVFISQNNKCCQKLGHQELVSVLCVLVTHAANVIGLNCMCTCTHWGNFTVVNGGRPILDSQSQQFSNSLVYHPSIGDIHNQTRVIAQHTQLLNTISCMTLNNTRFIKPWPLPRDAAIYSYTALLLGRILELRALVLYVERRAWHHLTLAEH